MPLGHNGIESVGYLDLYPLALADFLDNLGRKTVGVVQLDKLLKRELSILSDPFVLGYPNYKVCSLLYGLHVPSYLQVCNLGDIVDLRGQIGELVLPVIDLHPQKVRQGHPHAQGVHHPFNTPDDEPCQVTYLDVGWNYPVA